MKTNPIPSTNNPQAQKLPSKAMSVAREFEALFTSMMLKSMRNTVFDGGLMPKGLGEKFYTELLDGEYAKIIADNASLGLAEQIMHQMDDAEDNDGLLKTFYNIGNQSWMLDPSLVPGRTTSPAQGASLAERLAPWSEYIDEASTAYSVDKSLIKAVIAQESAGNPYAISRAGAKGLMQLMDSTATTVGVSQVFNPRENIMGGTRYLKQMLENNNGNEALALASYNAGPNAVKKYGGIPPYQETINYVSRVLGMREEFKNDTEAAEPAIDLLSEKEE